MRSSPLGLAHLSLLMCTPPVVIQLAARAGFTHVGVRVLPATSTETKFPLQPGSSLLAETRRALDDYGISVLDIEALNLDGSIGRDDWLPPLEAGGTLGATVLNVIGSDRDTGRLIESFGRLAQDAAEVGITASLEPISYQPLSRLDQAQRIIDQTGVGGIMLDTLHFTRSGQIPSDIASIRPELFTVIQVCDGPANVPAMFEVRGDQVPMNQSVHGAPREQESRLRRQLPGAGAFRLTEILAALPVGVPVSVEVPDPVLVAAIGAKGWASELFEAGIRLETGDPRASESVTAWPEA